MDYPELSILKQFLPKKSYSVNEDEEDEKYPFVVVRLDEGNDDEDESFVKVDFVIGYKSREEEQNYESLLSILEKIRQHYQSNRFLEHFEMDKKLSWRMQDKEDYYPYFYGYISTVWNIPSVIEGDELI
jgi:hypothetical protein